MNRFICVFEEHTEDGEHIKIYKDTVTRVLYLKRVGNAGFTVLVDATGRPMLG